MHLSLLVGLLIWTVNSDWLPKRVWTFWMDEIEAGSDIELYHLNHLAFTKGWELTHLNLQAAKALFAEKVPGFKGFTSIEAELPRQKIANFVRLILMREFGGVWFDFSVILTEQLDWVLLQNLKQERLVRNKHG